MSTLPDDILHAVSKYLKPKELYSFLLTSRGAKDAVSPSEIEYMKRCGPIFKEYDKIFKSYDWVESVEARGLVPLLIYRNERKTYVDLVLAVKKMPRDVDASERRTKRIGFGAYDTSTTSEEQELEKEIVFDKIFRSLRCQNNVNTRSKVVFPGFTLDLGGVLACPCYIPTRDLTWARPNGRYSAIPETEIIIYGQGKCKIRGEFHSGLFWFRPAGFELIAYQVSSCSTFRRT